MMDLTTLTILSETVHGVPSGNYDGSSLAFDSDGQKGVGYYRGQGNLQTVWIRVTDFQGRIQVQASLDENWQSAAWFDVYDYDHSLEPISDAYPATLTGNFAWVRVRVTDFQAGTINSVTVTY
jgi:hypothetical protein